MAYPATAVEVFIASPSDVPAERDMVREVVAEWNAIHARSRAVVLLPVGWETHSSPELGGRPQQMINDRLLSFADVLIGIFFTRVGTATGGSVSGTIEEINEHIEAGKPAMLYFSKAPLPRNHDRDQLEELEKFKAEAFKKGIVAEYDTVEEFGGMLRRQLQIAMNDNLYLRRVLGSGKPSGAQLESNGGGLSERAKMLLAAAAGGRGQITFRRFLGGAQIFAGDENMTSADVVEAAKLQSAIGELKRRGFIRDESGKGNVFTVTGEGYEALEAED